MLSRGFDGEAIGLRVDELIVLLNILVESGEEFVDERIQVRSEGASFAVEIDEDVAIEKPTRRKGLRGARAMLYVL